MEAPMNKLVKRWRLLLVSVALAFIAFVTVILTCQSDARRAHNRVKLGMKKEDVKYVVGGQWIDGFEWRMSDFWTVLTADTWRFEDESLITVRFKDGRVDHVCVDEPDLKFRVQRWLFNRFGLRTF